MVEEDPWWFGDATATLDGSEGEANVPPRMSPYPRADMTVELPFESPERTVLLTVQASAAQVDVHLSIDTTSSFDGEIDELQNALLTTVIPGLRMRIPSLTLGVSSFQDMPYPPWGATTDRPFQLRIAQTSDLRQVSRAVELLDQPLGIGGDRPESWAEALYQIATGEGLRAGSQVLVRPFVPVALPDSGHVGGVGFRSRSTRVVVLVTDAPTHEPMDYFPTVSGAHSTMQAVEALRRIRASVVGIVSAPDARSSLERVALATGAVAPVVHGGCTTGLEGALRAPVEGVCPLVYDIAGDGTGLSRTIVDGIHRLLDAAVYDEVHGTAMDDPQGFVTAIEAEGVDESPGPSRTVREDRWPADTPDGTLDTFTNVRSGARLTFRLHLRNRTVRETELPQVFFVRVVITGDGLVLRESLIRVIVPEGPKQDAGFLDGRGMTLGDAARDSADHPHRDVTDSEIKNNNDGGFDGPEP